MNTPPISNEEQDRFDEWLQEGISAAKNGNRKQAKTLLEWAADLQPGDARPWIWLSATTDDPDMRRDYLEKAVAADPSDATARRALVMLSDKLDKTRLVPEGAEVKPINPQEPEEIEAHSFRCPQCGGQLAYDVVKSGLACANCGYVEALHAPSAADSAEQVLDFTLPTTRAHRWAEARQMVSCEKCGAVVLLPPEQKADQCPYCGSNRLITGNSAVELVDPHVIGLMKLDAPAAAECVRRWLGKGFFAPDDLLRDSQRLQLRPAYYPFWTFDGTLEVPWTCEVNEGTSRYPHWVARTGTEFELFDDVLVPGTKALDSRQVHQVEPFKLKEVVEFNAKYLAGWTTLNYDVPMAEASLQARQEIVAKLRSSLHSKVEPGREKRNLNSGGGKWSGQTFKLALLPLWAGAYEFKGKQYPLMVNGQTGKVGGTRPSDPLKVVMVTVGAVVAVLFLTFLVYELLMGAHVF